MAIFSRASASKCGFRSGTCRLTPPLNFGIGIGIVDVSEEWIAQQMPGTKVDEGEDVEEQHHRLRDTECVVRSDRQRNE